MGTKSSIFKDAKYIYPGNCPHENNEDILKKYRELVLKFAGLSKDTLFDAKNSKIISLFNKNLNIDKYNYTNLIIDNNIYQISIFSPSYCGPSPKMVFSLYDVSKKKYAILWRSNEN
jgi:hypothetical protein